MSTIVAVLNRMEQLLTQGWCQKESALDKFGQLTGASNPNAVSWCFQGARYRAAADVVGFGKRKLLYDSFGRFVNEVGKNDGCVHACGWHVTWNDHPAQTQDGVLSYVRYLKRIALECGL